MSYRLWNSKQPTRNSSIFYHLQDDYLINFQGVAVIIWIIALAITSTVVYSHHPMKSSSWDNRAVDGLINAFCRPLWTFSLGCMIFACHFGYGGKFYFILFYICEGVLRVIIIN